MKDSWENILLGDVCSKIGSGATPRGGKESYKSSGISLIRSQNVLDFSFSLDGLAYIDNIQAAQLDNVCVEKNDVLINITGDSVARACIAPSQYLPARVNQHVAIVRGNPSQIDNRFILYFLQKQKQHLLSIGSTGGTRNALTKSMLEGLVVDLPPLQEQRAIAATLSCLDDKIELNNKINANLEAQAQAIFKSWFVNFEPFQDGEFVDSELGRIPKGWEVTTLGDVCERITKGTTPTTLKKSFTDSGINFVKAESIGINHTFDFAKFSHIDQETNDLLTRSIIQKSDILFTMAGTIGRFGIVDDAMLPANTNQAVAIIRVGTEKLNPIVIYSFFVAMWHKEYYFKNIQQAVQANLSLASIKSLPILIPNDNALLEYERIIQPLFTSIFNATKQNRTLAALRDTLLPKLMSGEITPPVGVADIPLKEGDGC